MQTLIGNYRRLKATEHGAYADAMTEWSKRNSGELDLDQSIAYLRDAAARRKFVSYSELALASGVSWDRARYPMNAHLGILVDYAIRQGWPMLSAIVVNKQHLDTGEMDDATMQGFIKCAHDLGLPVADESTFLKDQQQRVFDWGGAKLD